MDNLCSYGLDRKLQIKLVRCWPCLRECLVWPFPPRPLVVGSWEYLPCHCPQTVMHPAGHQMSPLAKGLLAWPGEHSWTSMLPRSSPPSQLVEPCLALCPGLSMPFGSLETSGRTQIGSVGIWPPPGPTKEAMAYAGPSKGSPSHWKVLCFSKEI